MRTWKNVFAIAVAGLLTAGQAKAQKTLEGMQLLTVNENVTTVITASEPVRFVDISTGKVVGDQPINNTIRLKPKEGVEVNRDGDILAIVTPSTALSTPPIRMKPSPTRPSRWTSAQPITILPSVCLLRTWHVMPVRYGLLRLVIAMWPPNVIA